MARKSASFGKVVEIGLRLALPCAILALGWLGFSQLAVEVEDEPPQTAEKRILRTRVRDVELTDYPVVIRTHGIVQAHNQVTLSAEVRGVVTKVNPAFETGAYFSKGDVLVEIDRRSYENALAVAEARVAAARSALELARLTEQRMLRLIESNAVPRAEVDAASATREQAEADLDLALAQAEQSKLDLQRTKVCAPFNGRVQAKNVGLGQMADANSPLGEIFAIDFAEVRLPISASQREFLELPELADDPPLEVYLEDSLDESLEGAWPAKIVRTEGMLDENSRDLFAVARIDDPFGRKSGAPPLRIGQPVVAAIQGHTLRRVVALPRGAVRQLDRIVLVDRNDQTLLPMTIEPIWSDAEHVVISDGVIPDGMWLATTPMVFTPAGAPVEIIPNVYPTGAVADAETGDASSPIAN